MVIQKDIRRVYETRYIQYTLLFTQRKVIYTYVFKFANFGKLHTTWYNLHPKENFSFVPQKFL